MRTFTLEHLGYRQDALDVVDICLRVVDSRAGRGRVLDLARCLILSVTSGPARGVSVVV